MIAWTMRQGLALGDTLPFSYLSQGHWRIKWRCDTYHRDNLLEIG